MKKHILVSSFVIILFSQLLGCGKPVSRLVSEEDYRLSGITKQGAFSLERVELNFTGGLTRLSVPRGQSVQVEAVVKFTGQGNFRANWMLDQQIIKQLNINLYHGAVLKLLPVSISSRALAPGNHRIYLQIHEPKVQFPMPEIAFFVEADGR